MILGLPYSLLHQIITILYALSSFNILIPLIVAEHLVVDEGYDFVIVGAGSSGAVIASRLSEKPHNYKVLLLEAGGKEHLLSQIPLLNQVSVLGNINWHFKSEPQEKACLGMKERRGVIPAGKIMGGGSSVNDMLYIRGNHRDYDLWASFGNYGWGWKDVAPYFLKSEKNFSPNLTNDVYHGKTGLLAVSNVPYQTKLVNRFQEAVQSMGYSIRDVNGEFQSGVMPIQATMFKGKRCSTNRAFIKPASKRPNLRIMTHARVLKVLFDKKRAIGVAYVRKGKEYHVKVSKEVILSAGTMNTPKILMLSGIGPKKHLSEHKINTILNLPGVGQNLQDHVVNTGIIFTIKTNDAISITNVILPQNLLRYVFSHSGSISIPSSCEVVAFMKTRYANQGDDWPDAQIHLISTTPLADFGIVTRPLAGYSDEAWNQYFRQHLGKNSFMVLPFVLHTKSRGFVKLRSKNPYDDPIIDPKYFSHPDDVKVMVEAVKISVAVGNHTSLKKFGTEFIPSICPGCEKHIYLSDDYRNYYRSYYRNSFSLAVKISVAVGNHTSLKKFGTEFIPSICPGCEKHIYLSDDYWTCFARYFSTAGVHLTGTAKMGNKTDPMAVVDPELRVYGVKGLRVADCSVMPVVPSGNTNVPAIMVGEKAADMIKNTYNKM